MQDKRRVHRLNFDLPVTFKVSGPQRYISLGATLNISAIGIGLRTKELLEPGDDLFITIKLPDGKIITVEAVVVWTKEVDFYKHRDYSVGLRISERMKMNEKEFVDFFAQEFLKSYKTKLTP